jgi:hypothetical protein
VVFADIVPEEGSEVLTALAIHSRDDQEWQHAFWFHPGAFVFSNDPMDTLQCDAEVHVMSCIVFTEVLRLCSDSPWVPWADFVVDMVDADVAHRAEAAAGRRAGDAESLHLLREHPWLADLMGNGSGASSRGASAFMSGKGAEPIIEEEEEIDVDAVFSALASARAEALEEEVLVEHFGWTLRGGLWTRLNRGTDIDSFRACSTDRTGADWLRRWHLPLSSTFAISRYGEHACAVLSRYWVARMTFLFLQDESGAFDEGVSDAVLARFVEPSDFRDIAGDATGHLARRISELRELRPLRL